MERTSDSPATIPLHFPTFVERFDAIKTVEDEKRLVGDFIATVASYDTGRLDGVPPYYVTVMAKMLLGLDSVKSGESDAGALPVFCMRCGTDRHDVASCRFENEAAVARHRRNFGPN